MSMIFLATGTCTLGVTKRDKDGNIIESTPARFTWDDTGGSIAIGEMDPKTKEINEESVSIFGDWDAAGYLAEALEQLKPRRKTNIPDFKTMVQNLWKDDRVDICDHCRGNYHCTNCIVNEWKEEQENDS